MACPYFEPLRVASPSTYPEARLPLIDEYEGLCRAIPGSSFAPAAAHRFRHCNHGNVQGVCEHFPLADLPTSLRYQIALRDERHLEVLVIEEKHHWPHSWRRFNFQLATQSVDPDLPDAITRAQLLAFCRSYLKRFAG